MENQLASGENSRDELPYLLIGSNIRFLAENAVKHGHAIYTVDYYGDWDMRKLGPNRSVLKDGDGQMGHSSLINLGEGITNGGVIYGPGFENDIVALRGLQKLGAVLGCDIKSARSSRNPESIMRAASTWGFKYPETLLENLNPKGPGKWLVKPLNSLGGLDIHFHSPTERAPDWPYVLQRYVEGMPSSAAVVSNGSDAAVLGVMTQILGDADFGASGFRFVGNVHPHPFAEEILEQVTEIAEALTLEFDLKGLWGFDFIFDGQVNLLEVNPRPTAGMGLLGADSLNDLLGLHVDSILLNTSDKLVDMSYSRGYVANARVFAEYESTFTGAEEWYEKGARDIPDNGDIMKPGAPVLTVSASGQTYKETMDSLKAQAALLRENLRKSPAPAY